MLEWMVNFVEINNLIVGKDVKLDELKIIGWLWFFIIGKIGIWIGIGIGIKIFGLGFLWVIGGIIGMKFCVFFGVVKRVGISLVGFWSFGVRFVMLGKIMNRKLVF